MGKLIFKRSLAGLASVGANQEDLTTCAQKCGQEEGRDFWQEGV
jgi:hypothetical protein